MVKSAVILAAFSMLFTQFVHAAVVDATDDHSNHNHIHIALTDAHHHDHSDSDEDHDDDHGLGSLHNSMHDMQNIALPSGQARTAAVLSGTKRSIPLADIHTGLVVPPPVPPPLT